MIQTWKWPATHPISYRYDTITTFITGDIEILLLLAKKISQLICKNRLVNCPSLIQMVIIWHC